MKIILDQLQVQTKQSNEHIVFSDTITYIYGPVGKGKSRIP